MNTIEHTTKPLTPEETAVAVDVQRLVSLPAVALTIKQPWASLIIDGGKDIENRSWPTRFRGSVLIHASKKKDENEWWAASGLIRHKDIRVAMSVPWTFASMHSGGIIGVAEIVACVTHSQSPWFVGEFGFVITNARPLPFFACKGALGFWHCEYPSDLLRQANDQTQRTANPDASKIPGA